MPRNSHPCDTIQQLPATVDQFLEHAMGSPVDMLRNIHDPRMLTVSVDLRDLYQLAGPEWQAFFRRVSQHHRQRVAAGQSNEH